MKIQSTIAGFHGQPVTIIGQLDDRSGILVLVKDVAYREERISDEFALVSNLDLPEVDFRFTDRHLADAIRAYYMRRAQRTLSVEDALRRFEPDNKIEGDSVDEGGRRYRIAGDIQNGQVAVLAAVALATGQATVAACVGMADELAEFYRVQSI